MGNATQEEIRLGIGDLVVPRHAHVAFYLENDEDVVSSFSFLAEGLRGRDYCILICDEKLYQHACGFLTDKGFDVADLKEAGRLTFLPAAGNCDAVLEPLKKSLHELAGIGAGTIRILGKLPWMEQGAPSVMDLLELEAEVALLAGAFPCAVVCLYDMRTLPGLITRYGAQETHAIVIRGRSIEKNPFFVPGEIALQHLEEMSNTFCDFQRVSTERRRTERALVALRKLSTELQSALEVENILDELIESSAEIVGAEGGIAAICFTEGISGYRHFRDGKVVPPDDDWTPDQPIRGRLFSRSLPFLANDALHDDAIDPALAERHGVRSLISTPIVDASGEMIGFLEMHNKVDGSGFSSFDQDQLASAAQIAALAARNANAFRKVTQMGARLRESTERYRHLVEGLDAIVWEADAQTYQFTFVSKQAESILGYPVSQWLEEPDFLEKHIHPEDRRAAAETCRLATAQGRDHRFLCRAIAADGRVVWLRIHVRIVFDSSGKVSGLRGIMVDITESMSTQEALRTSEARLRSTFEGAGIGMALVDRDWRPLQCNPVLLEMLGYSQRELVELSLSKVSHPEDAQADRAQFETLMDGKLARYQVERRLIRKDGKELFGRITVSAVQGDGPQYAIVMVEDVSERQAAEVEVAQLLAQVQKDAAELERRVAERTAQLEEINEELDSFAHSVSHDLRAPLRAMQGFAEILLENGTVGETERLEYLTRILSAAQGMERLIQNLLAYSRLSRQEIVLEPVSLDHVVRDAAQQLELASGGKKYELEVKGKLPEVMGRHAVLVQVVLNLMTNGIKFVSAGVTPKLRIWAEEKDDLVRLFVQDNGIGIPPEHQERIFKIFERLHSMETYPGTGVGLAIVRKAVMRLGGRIGVISRVGEGSRFWIELRKAGATG